MAAFSQKDREVGDERMKTLSEGTPIWLRSHKRIGKLVKKGFYMG